MLRYKLVQEVVDNLQKAVDLIRIPASYLKVKYSLEAIADNNLYFLSDQLIDTSATFELDTTTGLPIARQAIRVFYKDIPFAMPISWVEETEELPKNLVWGTTKYRTSYFSEDHLLDQIRVRYAFYDRPVSGLMNVVMDNYMPKIMHNARLNTENTQGLKLPKTTYCISPWFADIIGSHQITAEQLCRVLGYTAKDIKQLIIKAKATNHSITFVGYGGTNVNTIHWLTEMMKFTNSVNLFKFVEIVEPDTLEVSNLLRFPIHPGKVANNSVLSQWTGKSSSKLRLLDRASFTLLSRNRLVLSTSMLSRPNTTYSLRGLVYDYDSKSSSYYKANSRHIFYGAPSIATRPVMSAWGNFIAATHSGNSCQLWLNPTQDVDLQVESYGLISLTQFFMNQLRMAIGLLETIANNVDLTKVDTPIMSYTFDGTSKLPTDRTYNFQTAEHSGTVATEEEALNTF